MVSTDKNIAALADPSFMPSRKALSDKDNGRFDLIIAYEKYKKYISTLLDEVTSPPLTPLADFTKSDFTAYKKFEIEHPDMVNSFANILRKKCLTPESLPLLIDRPSIYEYLVTKLTIDAISIYKDLKLSDKALDMLMRHLKVADAHVNCEGSLLQSIVSLNYLGGIIAYANELKSLRKLTKPDSIALANRAKKISINNIFLKAQMRREYRYSYIVALQSAHRSFTQKIGNRLNNNGQFLFNLKATVAHINKYYYELFRALDKNQFSSFTPKWLNDYTKITDKVPDSIRSLRELLTKGSFTKESDQKSKINNQKLSELQKIIKKQPSDLNNYLGRVFLKMIHTNYLKSLKDLITERDQLLKTILALKK